MARNILIEEFRLTLFVQRKLPDAVYAKIHKTLNRRRFRTLLKRAVRRVCRRYRSLANIQIKVSR